MSGIVGNNTGRGSGVVQVAAVAADAITGAEIADDAVDSEHYVDGSIDNAHINDLGASKLTGTIADARFPATLPAASGVNLTALNATNLGSGTVPTARLGSGTASSSTFLRGDQTYAEAGGGKVLQILQTVVTAATATIGSTTLADVAGMTQAITPSATSSKILITGHLVVGGTNLCTPQVQIMRDSTAVGIGDANSSNNRTNSFGTTPTQGVATTIPFEFLDSPSTTSATTYKIRWGGGGTFYLNRTYNSGTGADLARTVSVITLYEIGA